MTQNEQTMKVSGRTIWKHHVDVCYELLNDRTLKTSRQHVGSTTATIKTSSYCHTRVSHSPPKKEIDPKTFYHYFHNHYEFWSQQFYGSTVSTHTEANVTQLDTEGARRHTLPDCSSAFNSYDTHFFKLVKHVVDVSGLVVRVSDS